MHTLGVTVVVQAGKGWTVVGVALASILALGATGAPPARAAAATVPVAAQDTTAAPTFPACPDLTPTVHGTAKGSAALQALGPNLARAAQVNRIDAQPLIDTLRHDDTAQIDDCGRITFVEPATPAAGRSASTSPAAAAATATAESPITIGLPTTGEPLALSSRPGSKRTIFIDFTGPGIDYVDPQIKYLPYDSDGDPAKLSAAESEALRRVWQQVAEDYAPFDVNVTTEDPGAAAINYEGFGDETYGTRVMVTSGGLPCYLCVGLGSVSTFVSHSNYTKPTAFAGATLVGNVTQSPEAIAGTVSHEVGHNFGLLHHGLGSSERFHANSVGVWAPIMGGGGGTPMVSQWSNGAYLGATRKQDDMRTIARIAPLMPRDHGAGPDTATPLSPGGRSDGLITSAADDDWYTFTSTGGPIGIAAHAQPTSPNLDFDMEVFDSTMTRVGDLQSPNVRDSPATAAGTRRLSATAAWDSLPAGKYYVRIKGAGEGDPLVDPHWGYSSYGSVGRYAIFLEAHDTLPSAPTNLQATSTDGFHTATITFTSPVNTGLGPLLNYEFSTNDGTTWFARTPAATDGPVVLTDLPHGGLRMRAVNTFGHGPPSATIIVPPTPDPPTWEALLTGPGSVTLRIYPPRFQGVSPVTSYDYSIDDGKTWTRHPGPDPASSSMIIDGLTPLATYQMRLRANNSAGHGAASYAKAVTPVTRPDPPTGVRVTPGDGTLSITWKPSTFDGGSPISTYTVYGTVQGHSEVLCAVWVYGPFTCEAAAVNGVPYSVTVTATNVVGTSFPSEPVTATPATVPQAPWDVAADAGDRTITVTWRQPGDGGAAITGYTATATPGGENCTTSGQLTCIIQGLTNGQTYTVAVTARNALGSSPPGAAYALATPLPRYPVPNPPTAVTATPARNALAVSWTAPHTDGGFPIQGYTATASPGGRTCTTRTTNCVITGLTAGRAYRVTVTAADALTRSAPSLPSPPVTVPALPDAPVTARIAGFPAPHQATVTWTAAATNPTAAVTGYRIAVSRPNSTVLNTAATTPVTSYTFTRLVVGATYRVTIVAVNANGESPPFTLTFRQATPPSPPQTPKVAAWPAPHRATITWTAPATNGGSTVQRYLTRISYPNSATRYGPWVTQPGSSPNARTLIGLTKGATYRVQILAANSQGNSATTTIAFKQAR